MQTTFLIHNKFFRQTKCEQDKGLECNHRGRGSLHSQVEHHVRDKFATPILYGIDNFKFYDIFLHIHNH